MTMVLAGPMVPRTAQYGAGAPAVSTVADWMVTGASVTPVRSRLTTAAQSMTGMMAGRSASPPAAFASECGRLTVRAAAPHAAATIHRRPSVPRVAPGQDLL